MTHPLLVLARAYDASYANEHMRSKLAEDTTAALDSGEMDAAVCAYAAHFAVLTQTFQLGKYGVYEEPQTDALFGLLTGSFWHASILAEAYNASEGGNNANEPLRLKRWVHQTKKDEAEFGYDFGILVDLGGNRIKITLFQAKRPDGPKDFRTISTKRSVRGSTGTKIPSSWAELDEHILEAERDIKVAAPDANAETLTSLQARLSDLKEYKAETSKKYSVMRQRNAITLLRKAIAEHNFSPRDIVRTLNKPEYYEFKKGALERENSLFSYPYAYEQSDAFLATALHGWCHDPIGLPPVWCFYVQWTNRNAGFPWSLPIEIALQIDAHQDPTKLQLFSKTLTAALSIHDQDVGWIIEKDDLGDIYTNINKVNPHIMWATISDSKQNGKDLLMTLGLDESEISDSAEYNLGNLPSRSRGRDRSI